MAQKKKTFADLLPSLAKGKKIMDESQNLIVNADTRQVEYKHDNYLDRTPPPMQQQYQEPYQEPQLYREPIVEQHVSNNRYNEAFMSEEEILARQQQPQNLNENLDKSGMPDYIKESLRKKPPMQVNLAEVGTGLTEEQIRMVNPNRGQRRPQNNQRPQNNRSTNSSQSQMVDMDSVRNIVREELERFMGKLILNGKEKNLTESLDLRMGDEIKIIKGGKAFVAEIFDVKNVKVRKK